MLSGTGKKLTLIILIFLMSVAGLSAQSLSLSAELGEEQIWLGDSVVLTLYLQGSEDAISPNLDIPEVRVEPLGGTVRSSRSITNINGKVSENIRKAYVYAYKLTPKIAGRIIIPSIEVNIEGANLISRQLVLDVKQPQQSDDFRLELEFDRSRVYLNEECSLKVRFLYGQSLRTLEISIPGLESMPFKSDTGKGNNESYEINLNGSPVIFSREDQGDKAGLSAVLKIRPAAAGRISLQNATASFERVTGYQRVQDFFGRTQRQEVYGRSVIAGKSAAIQVLPFPKEGQPDDFFGLSGRISMEVSVEPSEVHIGDPMTLSLAVTGMNNTDIRIPPLGGYLGEGIDLPDTRSSSRVEGRSKIITQTVRIKDASIKMIPPLSFSYFNTESENYEYSSSAAVPIRVLDTKIVTSAEIEGSDPGGAEDKKILLERKREGIYYNYSGKELLTSDRIMIDRLTDSALIKILLLLPPAVFLIILIYTGLLPQVRARAEARVDRRRALRRLLKASRKAGTDDPKSYIRDFDRHLSAFLKAHGDAQDETRLKDVIEQINSVLYGKMEISPEQARAVAATAVEILGAKEERNA